MEEVDRHLLETSKYLECSFCDEGLEKLSQFSTENSFEFVVRCLWSINPSSKEVLTSCVLPPNIRDRFRLATICVDQMKKIKVRGEYGYQTLLYGGIVEMRNLLLGLVEKLPRQVEVDNEDYDATQLLLDAAARSINESLWVPEFCRRLQMRHDGRFWCPSEAYPELFPLSGTKDDFWKNVRQSDSRSWISQLFTDSQTSALNDNKPSLAPKPRSKPSLPPKPSSKDTVVVEQPEVSQQSELERKIAENDEKRLKLAQIFYEKHEMENKLKSLQNSKINEKLLTLLENPVEGEERIMDYLEKSHEKLKKLEMEWESVESEKRKEIDELRKALNAMGRSEDVVERIELMEEQLIDIKDQTKQKTKLVPRLEKRLALLSDENINRAEMTTRIMEMIANITKQQQDMDKIMKDVEKVRKGIKWSSQTLERSFNIIEETLFQDSEHQKGAQAYRLFGRINLKCNSTMEIMEQKGQLVRDIEQLENQIEIEKQKRFSAQLEKIQKDTEEVEQENHELERKVEN